MPENQNMQKTSDNEAMLQEIVQNTEMGKSTRNLATMLAEGSGQGVLDFKRAETDYPQASPGAHKLMEELCAFQTGAEQAWREFV